MSISINSAPLVNRFLLDANNTLVSITSTNGIGYYFRAFIYVDDVLFDTQGWSRKDNFTAIKDLKKLYAAYYETIFNETFNNGIVEQTHLLKKVSITIEERQLATDIVVDSIFIPVFYMVYNIKPTRFNDQEKAVFTGINAQVLQISKNGKISIPFYVNALNENIVCQVKDNFGTVLNTQTNASVSGKRFYIYKFDLNQITLAFNCIYLTVKVTVGIFSIEKNIRILVSPNFLIKEIAYLNNFGFYNYAYIDGSMQIDNTLEINSYLQNDGSDKIAEIDEEQTYTINTGSLLESEKLLINEITTALEVKLFFNSKWYDLNTRIKKTILYKERSNNYSENLSFKVKQNTTLLNIGLGVEIPVVSLIYIDSVLVSENTPNQSEIAIVNDSNTSETGYTLIAYKFINNLIEINITATVIAPASAVVINYTIPEPGLWSFYIKKGTFSSDVVNQLFQF